MSHSNASSSDQERYSRRLSDKIQTAFDHACDEGELQVAADLLQTLELVPLMASHERLWHLRAKTAKKDSEPATAETVSES